MYTVRFQLELSKSEKRFLSKSFFYANKIHNQVVRHATNRLSALFHDKEYMEARKAYGEAEFSKKNGSELSASEKKKKKEFSDIMNNKQKCAATGVRLSRWDTICFMKHYYKVRVPKNEYIQNIISSVDLKEDVVYSFLKRIEFNSGFKYYVVITLRGDAPKRIRLSEDGGHRTGVDFGTSTIAAVSNGEVHLEELAPESAKYEKEIRHKQNLVDASMRKHNPENYNKNGTVKKGKHKWKTTKRCRRLKRQVRVLYRKQSAYIKTSCPWEKYRRHITKINANFDVLSSLKMTRFSFSQCEK